jgi:hypothetical protein
MHQRDAAQDAVAQVKNVISVRIGTERRRNVIHVRDYPDQVAQVKRPGLARNVARRKMMTEKGMHVGPPVLGQNRARAIAQKVVDHHPVIAGQLAELRRSHVAERLQIGRPLKQRGGSIKLAEQRGRHLRFRWSRLDLHDRPLAARMGTHVEFAAGRRAEPADKHGRPGRGSGVPPQGFR